MPTISPRADRERNVVHRERAGIVQRVELVELEPRVAGLAGARRLHRQFLGADHHARHVVGRQVGDRAVAGELAAAQHRHLVGERHHFAEFVGDHQDGEVAVAHHVRSIPSTSSASSGVSTEVGSSRISRRRFR